MMNKMILILILLPINVFSDTVACLDVIKKDTNLQGMAFEFENSHPDRKEFIRDFYKSGEQYPPFKKIKHVFESGKAKIQFLDKGQDKKCQQGVLAFFKKPNNIFICMDPDRTMGRFLDITVHEVLHFYQFKRLEVNDIFVFEFKGEKGFLDKALNYNFDPKKFVKLEEMNQFHNDSLELFSKKTKILLEKYFEQLDELSAFFFISEDLVFEVKKIAHMSESEALKLIPKEVLLQKEECQRKFFKLRGTFSSEEKSRLTKMIKNRFVEARFLIPVQAYCYEVQANILSAALNYLRYDRVKHIPECLKLFPNVRPGPIKDFQEFNYLMTEAGREYVSRLEKYGKEFSTNFGFTGYEKYFSSEGCGQGHVP